VARPAALASTSAASATQRAFKLDELDFVNTAAHAYLTPNVAAYRRMFLYCTVDRTRSSGLATVGLFILDGTGGVDGADLTGKVRRALFLALTTAPVLREGPVQLLRSAARYPPT
jgi:hypothetical protein